MTRVYQECSTQYSSYINNPESFIREVLEIKELFPWQVEICNFIKQKFSQPDNNMNCLIAIAGANNTGKSYFGNLLMVWHFATQVDSRNIMMTNSERQTKSTGYYRIQDIVEKTFDPSFINATEKSVTIKKDAKNDTSGTWDISFILKANHESALTGMHFPKMFFFFDECLKFPEYVWNALETMLISGRVLVYACANPLENGDRFEKIFHDRRNILGWYRRNVSMFEIPDKYYSPAFIEHRRLQYGENDSRYRANVLGLFPEKNKGYERFGEDLVINAMARTKELDKKQNIAFYSSGSRVVLSIDIAENCENGSSNALCLRRGGIVYKLENHPMAYDDFLTFIIGLIDTTKPLHDVIIDSNGIGFGFFNSLLPVLKKNNIKSYPVKMNRVAFSGNEFSDLRSQLAWRLSEWLNSDSFVLPEKIGLEFILSKLVFEDDTKGRLKLISKKDFKKILPQGYRLDYIDALLLSFYPEIIFK